MHIARKTSYAGKLLAVTVELLEVFINLTTQGGLDGGNSGRGFQRRQRYRRGNTDKLFVVDESELTWELVRNVSQDTPACLVSRLRKLKKVIRGVLQQNYQMDI